MVNRYLLHVTKQCNMCCTYCYENNNIGADNISIENFINNIDEIMKDPNDIDIEFIGGEPLLALDRIKLTCSYIKETYPNRNVTYMMTSNGTLYSDDIVDVLRYYNILLCISLDGNAYSHNINRHFRGSNKGTFDVVFANALKYKNVLAEKKLIIHPTVNKYTVGRLYENIKFIYDSGFKSVTIGVVHADFNSTFMIFLDEELMRVTNYFIAIKYNNASLRLITIDEPININTTDVISENNDMAYLEHVVSDTSDGSQLSPMDKIYYNILRKCYNKYKTSLRRV